MNRWLRSLLAAIGIVRRPNSTSKKFACIYERDGALYIHSWSKTTAGGWIFSEPVRRCSKDNPDELGQLVLECLAASRSGVRHPKSWTGLLDPLLKLANVRSERMFNKGAKCVNVAMEGEQITFSPMQNLTPKGDFVELPTKPQVTFVSLRNLGLAALDALNLAT